MEVLNKEKVLEHAKKLIDEGKLDRAIIEYRCLLDIDPKDMRIKLRIAELLARQKKMSEAVKVYNEVADSYTNDGFYLKAVTVYKNVLRLNPSLIDVNYKLAELYEKMGLSKDATHQYQILASALEQKGDYEALVDVRRKMVDLDPHDVANRVRLAETYQYRGMEEDSINEYEELVGEIKGLGKEDQLIELYEKILTYRPDNIEMIKCLCVHYYEKGEWKKITSRLDKKEKLLAGEVDLLLILADAYAHLNQLETAKNRYKEAAAILLEAGNLEKALDAYKEILVISPADEEDVRGLVTEIDADLFEKVKTEAQKKIQMLEEEAAKREKEIEVAETVDEKPVLGSKDKLPARFSGGEVKTKLREANAAFELGQAYHKMGLYNEAEPELTKALGIYKVMVSSGYGDAQLDDNIAKIEGFLAGRTHGPEPEEVKKDKVSVKPEVLKEKQSTPEDKGKPVTKKGVQAPKEIAPSKGDKKKNKRMGFV